MIQQEINPRKFHENSFAFPDIQQFDLNKPKKWMMTHNGTEHKQSRKALENYFPKSKEMESFLLDIPRISGLCSSSLII